MKIIYIANARIPTEKAHGIQIFKTCEAMVDAGVALELWLPKRRNQLKKLDPFKYYVIKNKFTLKFLPSLDLIGLLDFLPGTGYWIQSKTFANSIAKALKEVAGSAIVYSRDLIPLEPVRKAGLPYFYEAHTIPKKPSEFQIKIWKKARGVVSISKNLAQEFTKYISKDKILVAPDGVDLEKFQILQSKTQIRKELDLPLDQKIIMYTGHLYDWKGAGTLLEAARKTYQLPATSYKLMYVFVGGTVYDLEKFKESAKGLDNVFILGQKPHEEIPLYLAAADVLILPNSGKFEISRSHTSPLKMFEYMAAGRPIIASDLPSIREVLNEDAAVFTEPDSPKDLAEKISGTLENPELMHKIVENCLQKVQEYSWNSRARLILSFIERQ